MSKPRDDMTLVKPGRVTVPVKKPYLPPTALSRATDDDVVMWAARHGFEAHAISDLRCAFEDAQSFRPGVYANDSGPKRRQSR